MSKIKAAIVGCGGVHNVHAQTLKKLDTTELVAVCDNVASKAEASSEKYGAEIRKFEDILNDSEIKSVHICTPHFLHARMAIQAMEAGKMVLLEKPLATSLKDAEMVLATSVEKSAHIGISFQNRYRPVIRKAYDMMRDGSLGKILGGRAMVTWMRDAAYYQSVDWRGSWKREGGSLLINQTIHTLDLLHWLFGGFREITGSISRHVFDGIIETEDTAELRFMTESNRPVLFYATTGYIEDSAVFIEIAAENAKLRIEEDLKITWKDGRTETLTEEQASGPKAYWGVQHEALIADFYRSYIEGEKFSIDVSEAINAIRMLDKIYNDPAINHCGSKPK